MAKVQVMGEQAQQETERLLQHKVETTPLKDARGQALEEVMAQAAEAVIPSLLADEPTPRAPIAGASVNALEDIEGTLTALETGYWAIDLMTQKTVWSPAMYRLLGLSPEKTPASFEAWLERVYPEDRQRVAVVPTKTVSMTDYRIRRPDGLLVWHRNHMQMLLAANGQPRMLRGIVQDITELKETELKAERLAVVAARTQNAVVITDAEARIEWVNEGFERSTGYSLAEVLGRIPGSFRSGPGTNPAEVQRIREAIRAGRPIEAELINYARSGEPYWVRIEALPLLDAAERVTGYMAIEADITERRLSAQHSGVMQQVAAQLLATESSQVGLQRVVEALVERLGVRVAQFYHVSADDQPLQHMAASYDVAHERAALAYIELSRLLSFHKGDSLVADVGGPGMAWGTARTVELLHEQLGEGSSFGQQSRRWDVCNALGISSLILCPVQVNQRVLGVLEIASSTFLPGYRSLPQLLEQVAAQVAQFLLRQSERVRVETIFEHSPEAMLLVDPQGRVTAANARALELFGRLEGMMLSQLVDSAEALLLPATEVRVPVRRSSVEGLGFGADGRVFPASSSSAYIKSADLDFIIVSVRDLSELRRLEEGLAREQASLRRLEQLHRTVEGFIQGSPTPLLQVDAGWSVLRSNVAARRLLRWTHGQELSFSDCLKPALLSQLSRLAPSASLDAELLTLEGSTLPVEIRCSPMETLEGSSLLLSLTDLTERKRVEQAMIRAQKEAEASAQAKSQFLANMSHEIRTPLNAVLGLSQLALQRNVEPELRRYFEKIHGAAQGLLGLISDILDFSKIEAGMLNIERVEFSLEEAIYAALDLVALKAEQKRIELLCVIEPRLSGRMLGDPLRISQILRNLLSNAVKFTPRGEIEVSAHVVEQRAQVMMVELSVRDTGPGMSPETVAGLFKPFAQGDASSTRLHEGTGLGLVISKQLAGLMGGEIALQSVVGQGTLVKVRLPLLRRGEGEHEQRRRLPSSLRALKAMVVEDSPASRQRIKRQLESLSLEVLLASSGADALSQLEGLQGEAVVLLVDMSLPDMSGLELQQALAVKRPEVPVLMMVTSSEELAEHPEVKHGLRKPLRSSEVMDTLVEVLGSTRVHRPVTEPSSVTRFDGLRVLLVEDNDINQEIACELLRLRGVQVTVASQGAEALALLKRSVSSAHLPFDLILMDIQMPVMDGLTATRAIRALPNSSLASLPIVAMTAHAMSGDREKSLEAGMNDHLTKPLSFEELERILKRWQPKAEEVGRAQRPLFHADACLRRVAGNRALLVKLLNKFFTERMNSVEEIRMCLPEDRAGAIQLAHTLRGVTGNLGMERLADTFTELEKELLAGHSGQVQLVRLEDELTATLEAVRQWLRASAGKQEVVKPEGSAAELRGVLQGLGEGMELGAAGESAEVVQKLGERNWPVTLMPIALELQKALAQRQAELARSLKRLLLDELDS